MWQWKDHKIAENRFVLAVQTKRSRLCYRMPRKIRSAMISQFGGSVASMTSRNEDHIADELCLTR